MARLSDSEKRAIIARDKPGHEIVYGTEMTGTLDAVERRSQSQSPDIAKLRAKAATPVSKPRTAASPVVQDDSGSADVSALRELFFTPGPAQPRSTQDVGQAAGTPIDKDLLRSHGSVSIASDGSGASEGEADEAEIIPVRRQGTSADPYDAVARQAKGVVV